ncbi:hypothetical protein CROQUDRAFT_131275, partial [Cronartium quercuum f. sp. fusiforme G11]
MIGKEITRKEKALIQQCRADMRALSYQKPHQLILRVWLKEGVSLPILSEAHQWPNFALSEAEILADAAETVLGPRWGMNILVYNPEGGEWRLTDASKPFAYSPLYTELLIRSVN